MIEEAFADRLYASDGSLVARGRPGALLDAEQAAAQAESIAAGGEVIAENGARIALVARTLCLHGDTPGAVDIAAAVHRRLEARGIAVAPLGTR